MAKERRDTRRREGVDTTNAAGTNTGAMERRIMGRTENRGFDMTLYPGDYGENRCDVERKCLKRAGHTGNCWPNGAVGEAST